MPLFHVIAILVALTALFGYLNHRLLRLHPSIGVMFIALATGLVLIAIEHLGVNLRPLAATFLGRIPFDRALLQWMLGFLLFAGGLSVDLNELVRQRVVVFFLATAATVISMFIVGFTAFYLLGILGVALPLLSCLLFGALISPTDPIAVVSLMRSMGAPKEIETVISAESLFNDGVGVVLFLTLLVAADSAQTLSIQHILRLMIQEAFGGALLGLGTGYLVYQMLRSIQNDQLEILLTLGLVMGTYSLADRLSVSGPIAVVVAGLIIGNHRRRLNLSAPIGGKLHSFWELVEELLNAALFVLIGLVVLILPFTPRHFLAALLCIPVVLLARWLSVAGTIRALAIRQRFPADLIRILTWGGLRGGLAIAMALAIPPGKNHDIIIGLTYVVVAFSILVQGTTLRRFISRAVISI